MDRVRFGRALGYGARHAAKAVAQAVDAATTPSRTTGRTTQAVTQRGAAEPAAREPAASGTRSSKEASRGADVIDELLQAHRTVQGAKAEARAQTRELGRSVWAPFARLSGVLWLEVTGTFFAVIAAYLSQGLWRQRGALHLSLHAAEAGKYYLHAAAFGVFAYFAVSSFVRARRRQRS